jgi:hypothetical protein
MKRRKFMYELDEQFERKPNPGNWFLLFISGTIICAKCIVDDKDILCKILLCKMWI